MIMTQTINAIGYLLKCSIQYLGMIHSFKRLFKIRKPGLVDGRDRQVQQCSRHYRLPVSYTVKDTQPVLVSSNLNTRGMSAEATGLHWLQ